MKFISWNVNGLRASVTKGFEDIFKTLDADFFCLQETKMQAGQLDLQFEGYESYWNYADKKGYSGTAIYTKHTPLSVQYGRMEWERDFQAYLAKLDANKPVVVCGDMNVAHQEIDLKNPKTNRRNAGFTDEEREKMTNLLANGFIDTFRYLYPEQVTYSWWSYRFKAREKNTGWRIDYFLISERLKDHLTDAKIHTDIFGSDHCPVELDLTF